MSRPGKPGRQVLQAPRFAKSKRRLPPSAQLAVDDAVKSLLADPLSGEPKVSALKGVRVVKLTAGSQQLLLAYQFDAKRNAIEVLLDVGPHENFFITAAQCGCGSARDQINHNPSWPSA